MSLPLLALALVSAGCSQPPSEVPPADGTPGHGQLRLTDCQGVAAGFLGPASVLAGPRPPGWEPGGGLTTLTLQAQACQRVSLDGFERGPLHILLEFEAPNPFPVPAACRSGKEGTPALLTSLWVDDAQLASHLAEAYGMPAVAGDFSVTAAAAAAAGPLARQTWSWHRAGEPPSTLEFLADGQARADAWTYRLFWSNGTGLHFMDAQVRANGSSSLPAWGTLEPPMSYPARTGTGSYAGLGRIQSSLEATGDIHGFADFACRQPKGQQPRGPD